MGNGYTFKRAVKILFCLPSEKGSTLKGKNLLPFPFRVDLLSEGLVVLERKQGVTEVISLVKDGGECGRFIQLPQCDTKLQ